MNRITATHEAGHAVGRLLTARLMGYAFDEAVDHIDHRGICYGPMVSRRLQADIPKNLSGNSLQALWQQLSRCGTEDERAVTMYCRMMFIVMGPCAEARLARVGNPRIVWESAPSAQDRQDFQSSMLLYPSHRNTARELESAFLDHAREIVGDASVWGAINALAFELREGRTDMTGSRVAELTGPHLRGANVHALPALSGYVEFR